MPDNLEKPTCFVVMPISDHDGYKSGHFKRVYENIFRPACEMAGFDAIRADEVGETNLIHLDVLQKLLDSPMVLCDLSARNPNVLFELGLRQAFDKPVALVREVGTPPIFDIAPLRYIEYRNELLYEEVLADQRAIAQGLKATWDACNAGQGVNSLVRLLSLIQPASLPEIQEADKDPILQIIRAELEDLRTEFRGAMQRNTRQGTLQKKQQLRLPTKAVQDYDYTIKHGILNYLVDIFDFDWDTVLNYLMESSSYENFKNRIVIDDEVFKALSDEEQLSVIDELNRPEAYMSYVSLRQTKR